MKTTIKFLAVITACVLFTSCQQEEVKPQPSPVHKVFSANGNATVDKGGLLEKEKLASYQESQE